MNMPTAIVIGAALIAVAAALPARYAIAPGSSKLDSEIWRLDRWTGAMALCVMDKKPECTAAQERP